MEVRVTDRTSTMTDEVRETLERTLSFALSRFASEIDFVAATTEDINGPKGGIDKRCTLRAKTRRYGSIDITQDCTQLGSGLARAARRLGHSLTRTIKQKRSFGRDSIRKREAEIES